MLLSLPLQGVAVVPKLGSVCAAEELQMFESTSAALLEIGLKNPSNPKLNKTQTWCRFVQYRYNSAGPTGFSYPDE